MTFEYITVHVVYKEGGLSFYGIQLDHNKSSEMWLVVDKMAFQPIAYLKPADFNKTYKVDENSYMKIGGLKIWEKCKQIATDFIPEIFKMDIVQDNINEVFGDLSNDETNLAAMRSMYDSSARRIEKKYKGKPIYFKYLNEEYYVLVEDITIENWPYDENLYFPIMYVHGPSVRINSWNMELSVKLDKTKTRLGYADEIIYCDKNQIEQAFEVKTNVTNDMCINIENKYKFFMEMLRQSIPYNRILEAEKLQRK